MLLLSFFRFYVSRKTETQLLSLVLSHDDRRRRRAPKRAQVFLPHSFEPTAQNGKTSPSEIGWVAASSGSCCPDASPKCGPSTTPSMC